MVQTAYLYDPVFLLHDLRGHPENAERLEVLMDFLQLKDITSSLINIPCVPAHQEDLTVVHGQTYINTVERLSARGGGMLTGDTYVVQSTYKAAITAVGASVEAAQSVLRGDVKRAYALVRPPGHHAFASHGEGFCIFNNVAMATACALGRLSIKPTVRLQRVMIIDVDVHHGNGTESIFYDDPSVMYLSTHQSPLYPYTGRILDCGRGAGRGYNVNIPLPPGTNDIGYRQVFEAIVIPIAKRFQPELILVSAGYDTHWRDPLAGMSMSLQGISDIMRLITDLSDELCESRMVVILEGGYDLDVLKYGVYNTLQILMGCSGSNLDPIGQFHGAAKDVEPVIQKVKQLHHL